MEIQRVSLNEIATCRHTFFSMHGITQVEMQWKLKYLKLQSDHVLIEI